MELTESFEEPGYVCPLRRSLYGLKQAPADLIPMRPPRPRPSATSIAKESRLDDLGTPRSFLGIQFKCQAEGAVSIYQHLFIQKVLSDFGMETCQTKTPPINLKQALCRRPEEEPPDEEAKARFASAIGSFMYLMVGARPDIAFALGTLSRFTSQPPSHHLVALQ
jgi:hypothetical protein